MMLAPAIVFQQPRTLSVQRLALRPTEPSDAVIQVQHSGISTGTERLLWDGSMPPFPGMGYPLVPGYESVGVVTQADKAGQVAVGQTVFVPGSRSFADVHNLFGGAGGTLVAPADKLVAVPPAMGADALLLALAATAYHSVSRGGKETPAAPPQLIVGHGVMGRLLARLTVAAGAPAPTVWETQTARMGGAQGYRVCHPNDDDRHDYASIYDVSGDHAMLNRLIARLAHGGEVVLAGFYHAPLAFDFAPAFMREARVRVAAEWSRSDMRAVSQLLQERRLDLSGLVTHHATPAQAQQAYATAFSDADCLKMALDWSNT
ncbi:MAG: chlorophyll synthesis pathway protein BchC [Burkholderiaceae bacterium]